MQGNEDWCFQKAKSDANTEVWAAREVRQTRAGSGLGIPAARAGGTRAERSLPGGPGLTQQPTVTVVMVSSPIF